MASTYWQKQTKDKPLFPDLLWSRPENRAQAGKLLIIGGNAHGFAAPAEAYGQALEAGIGVVRVLLPDAVKAVAKHALETVDFAPSTPSGSFSKKGLAEFISHASWADGVLIAGDLGRNSETAILLESFLQKYSGKALVTKDAVDYFYTSPEQVLKRADTALVISLAQLQKLSKAIGHPKPVKFSMDILQLVDFLHDFTQAFPAAIVVKHLENIFVAIDGEVSTTKLTEEMPIWRVRTAAHVAVWWLQHLNKPFEALTTSVNSID